MIMICKLFDYSRSMKTLRLNDYYLIIWWKKKPQACQVEEMWQKIKMIKSRLNCKTLKCWKIWEMSWWKMSDFLTINLDEKLFLFLSISARGKRWHVNEINCISPYIVFNTLVSLSFKSKCIFAKSCQKLAEMVTSVNRLVIIYCCIYQRIQMYLHFKYL